MAILNVVKSELRLTTSAFDDELTDMIAECKADMSCAGILVTDDTDELVQRAIKTYCKANFGLDNPHYERLMESYKMRKRQMALSTDYAYYVVTITASEQGEVIFDGISKETNDSGVVVFYSRAKNHVEYTVDGVTSYVDITGDTEIGA